MNPKHHAIIMLAASLAASPLPAFAGGNAVGPDIAVGALTSANTFGAVGGIHSYSLAFTACNLGDAPLDWFDGTPNHPVFSTQLYRLTDGRFEQIGLSWVFHEFFPLEINSCGPCTPSGDPQTLGVGCANVNSAGLGGSQQGLGPRTEVHAATGVFPVPFGSQNQTGDAIYKRLQAHFDDLQTPDARYFFEGQYIALDDAGAGNGLNNVSYRETEFSPASLSPVLMGQTVQETPAIYAWADADPAVFIAEAPAPDGGRYIVASRVEAFDTGEWRYEYAVSNQNSDFNAMIFEAPHMGRADTPRAFDFGFHDVDYHSGDPVDGTDWPGTEALFDARWEVPAPPRGGLLPNEIRWGTLYNFRFTSFEPPVETAVRITLRGAAGEPVSIQVPAWAAGAGRCNVADFSQPYYVLDLADIQTYIGLFTTGSPGADIVAPLGVLDLGDLQAFLDAFIGGCAN